MTWLAIFPAITLALAIGEPLLKGAPLVVRTLVLTAVLVPLMVFVLVPLLQHVLRGWLLR